MFSQSKGVTKRAGHQIRVLEEHLSLRLLHRTPRKVTLTPQGRELYDATASGFGAIYRTVARLRQQPVQGSIWRHHRDF